MHAIKATTYAPTVIFEVAPSLSLSALLVSAFFGDAVIRGGSHVPVVGLAGVAYLFFALFPLLLRSFTPSVHLLLFTSLVLPLVALCIRRHLTEFLEAIGLVVAYFGEATDL